MPKTPNRPHVYLNKIFRGSRAIERGARRCLSGAGGSGIPELMIAIEYDGRRHASAAQLERDRKRLNKLLGADWVVFHVTEDQMRHHFEEVVRELRAMIKRRQARTPTSGK